MSCLRRERGIAVATLHFAVIRPLLVALFLAVCVASSLATSSIARAEKAPLGLAEARIGQGLAIGGGAGQSTLRLSPITLAALASLAIQSEPWVAVYGGVVFEGSNRAALGATLGLRLHPQAGAARVSAGAVVVGLPFTAYGVSAGIGRCYGVESGLGFCTDIEATAFALGSDVPEGKVATQVQAVLGIAFDVF